MSHALGEVRFRGKKIAFFEYNGTSDVCCPKTYPTADLVWSHWRKEAAEWVRCRCLEPRLESVELWTDYGGGGKAAVGFFCLNCRIIAAAWDPHYVEYACSGLW